MKITACGWSFKIRIMRYVRLTLFSVKPHLWHRSLSRMVWKNHFQHTKRHHKYKSDKSLFLKSIRRCLCERVNDIKKRTDNKATALFPVVNICKSSLQGNQTTMKIHSIHIQFHDSTFSRCHWCLLLWLQAFNDGIIICVVSVIFFLIWSSFCSFWINFRLDVFTEAWRLDGQIRKILLLAAMFVPHTNTKHTYKYKLI